MSKKSVSVVVCTLAGLAAVSSSASAADEKPTFNANAQSCAQIAWRTDILEKYPNIDLACDSIVERGGKRYVKFKAEVLEQTQEGVKLQFPRTSYESVIAVDKEREMWIEGKRKKLGQLKRGDDISVYVPEDRFVLSFLDEKVEALGEGTLGQ